MKMQGAGPLGDEIGDSHSSKGDSLLSAHAKLLTMTEQSLALCQWVLQFEGQMNHLNHGMFLCHHKFICSLLFCPKYMSQLLFRLKQLHFTMMENFCYGLDIV